MPLKPKDVPVDCATVAMLDSGQLLSLWRRLHRRQPPEALRGELLARVLAHELQTVRHGGLSAAVRLRLKQVVADASRPAGDGDNDGTSPSRSLRLGTRMMREWQGALHEIEVVRDGYLWQGRTYRSLSTVAKAITGTSWNGWTFFGVKRTRTDKSTARGSGDV